jgi:hypothetical protein
VLQILFWLIAAILFGIAMFGVAARINLLAAGLLSFTLAWLVPALAGAMH